ncbi:MAG: family 16 glycoside hydrolase [Rhodopirellula sp. JB055]|uniref:family 16 glycoside hydrolase n=1 Tax=Rhodopirellula sp. JB055 TaxID=3342846 RepID=UPI00370ABB5E
MAEEAKTGKLIFEDRFERNESQELTDEVGNGWNTNSKSRANGHKQVDLKDGTMRIFIHETADHGVSVTQPMEFRDGRVEMKFMLEHEKDSLGLNFADLKYKKVWAGHLFRVTIGVKSVEITDLKTGVMDLKTRTIRKAGKVPNELQAKLRTKTKRVPHSLETGKWYHVAAEVVGDTMTVSIDGEEVASFASEGMAHPTKRLLRLAIKRNVVVDDVQIYSLD